MGKLPTRLKKCKPETWFLWSQVVLLAAICLVHAMEAGRYADFHPINGTFQNYNPVRRLLSGQIPYKDFQDYLGLGHLYSGTIMTLLFGGSYRSSLMAFSFLTFGAVILLCIVLGRAIVKKWPLVLAACNFVLLMILVQPAFFTNFLAWHEDVLEALCYATSSGNSARFLRGMVLPLCCVFYRLGGWLVGKILQKWPKLAPHQGLVRLCLAGVLGGFAFLWSNDYGICCWLCLAVMTFFVAWRRTKRFHKALLGSLVYGAASAIAVVVLGEVFTLGHLGQWVQSTFGTGGYQGWYFNTPDKSYYLFDVDFSFPMMVQALVCIAYLVKLLLDGAAPEALRRWGIPAFINMTGFAAVNAYKLISNGSSNEVALTALFITLLFECLRLAGKFTAFVKNKARPLHIAVLVMGFAWVISVGWDETIGWASAESQGAYIPAMGGVVTDHEDDLLDAHEFLQGESFFSTYASAQEVVEGKFQPSGTDYIIHALGDRQRDEYLQAFEKGSFTYTATILESDPWATWETRADWYFHRKLYEGWHPVYANGYELYWERGADAPLPQAPEVQIVDVDASTKKLVIQTDESINGIADVHVDYAIEKSPGLASALAFQPMVKVENTGTSYVDPRYYQDTDVEPLYYDSNYLRSSGKEQIPVNVVNGYGEATLTANPDRCCTLRIQETNCKALYTAAFDYVKAEDIVKNGPMMIQVEDTPKNRQCIKGVTQVELQGQSYEVAETGIWDQALWLILEGDGFEPEALKHGNILHIVRV